MFDAPFDEIAVVLLPGAVVSMARVRSVYGPHLFDFAGLIDGPTRSFGLRRAAMGSSVPGSDK